MKFDLSALQWGQLQLGAKLGEVEAVFPRADKSAVERMHKMEELKSETAAVTLAAPLQRRLRRKRPQSSRSIR